MILRDREARTAERSGAAAAAAAAALGVPPGRMVGNPHGRIVIRADDGMSEEEDEEEEEEEEEGSDQSDIEFLPLWRLNV